jgi:hypothetical protein
VVLVREDAAIRDHRWLLRPVWQHAHGTSQQRVASNMPRRQRPWPKQIGRRASGGMKESGTAERGEVEA